MNEPISLGHVILFDGEAIVIAIADERALLLHVSDGCTRTWVWKEHFVGKSRLGNAAETYANRAKIERAKSIEAVSARGTDQARWMAESAGRWDTLSRLIVALTLGSAPEPERAR